MKQIKLNIATAIGVLFVAGAACAAAGAYIGYSQGFKQGDFVGRYQASRSASAATSEMMTRGFNVKQDDGSTKTFVLTPVQTTKN